ncbi:O-antigen ligase family protein [Thermodesulfobacteriota bacterium]
MGIARMIGIDQAYGDPNSFAATIVYSMPFVYLIYKYETNFKLKSFYLFAYLPLAIICLLYTGSRSGQMTFLFFLVLLLLVSKRKLFLTLILIGMLSFIWIKAPESYKIRFESIFSKDLGQKGADASAEGRIMGFLQGIKILKENPVLGIGPGCFPYGWDGRSTGMNAHNLYGQLAGETGFIGIVGFTLLILQSAKLHWKNKNKSKILLCDKEYMQNLVVHSEVKLIYFISICSLQLLALLMFNGLAGHNLYRYQWLWIIAFGIISNNFLRKYKIIQKGNLNPY